jgi:hypothetical protein
MAFTNQAALEAVVADYLNRSDLTTQITDAVELCESRLRRSEATRTLTSQSLSLTTSPVSLPSDFRSAYSLYYNGDSSAYGPIEIVSPEKVMEYIGTWGTTGRPLVAAIIYDRLEMILGPVPSQTYTATLLYDQGMDSTYILEHFPDIYLYGTLVEMWPFIRDDSRIPLYEQRFQMALEELRRYNQKANWSGNTLKISPRRALGE